MAPVSGIAGEYTLPECTFTAPAGKQFKAWSVGGREKAAGDTITVTADTTLTAVWKDAGIPINAINIMGIPTPIAGQLPIVSGITTDTTGISLGDIIWCTPDSQNMIDRLKFEEGKTYTFSAYYTVDEGYELLSGVALTHDLAGGFNAKIVPSMKFIEIKYTVSAAPTYTVSFVSDGGSGTMSAVPTSGEYTLPACAFTAPSGKQFKCWSVNGEEKAAGEKIIVTADTVVTAVWKNKFIGVSGEVTVSGSKATARVTVENLSDSEAILIIAQYSGGQMKAVQTVSVTADGTFVPTAPFTHAESCTYKAFLVNADTYAPLCATANLF